MKFKEFELKNYVSTTHDESDFIKDILELFICKPGLGEFSMNIHKAWAELVLLDELEIMINAIVQENSTEFGSAVLLDFIQLIIYKADHSLEVLERDRRYKHDLYAPRRKIFNEVRKDLTLIKDRTEGLNDHLIELILALWTLKQKKGKNKFDEFWTLDLKEYWDILRNKCPVLFHKPEVTTLPSKDHKEKSMKRQKVKEKVAI